MVYSNHFIVFRNLRHRYTSCFNSSFICRLVFHLKMHQNHFALGVLLSPGPYLVVGSKPREEERREGEKGKGRMNTLNCLNVAVPLIIVHG